MLRLLLYMFFINAADTVLLSCRAGGKTAAEGGSVYWRGGGVARKA
jgi:hypothetical protein